MAEIFLSYRRQDSRSATGRLADRLEQHFGEARVFRDHASIIGGDDFTTAIARAIDASSVVLVVIGPAWLDTVLADGRRRLDDPGDFVRLEIESAIAAGVPLVPVLVEGAAMPDASALPQAIAAFARCQAIELSDSRWRSDTQRLIDTLHQRFAIEALPGAQASADTGSASMGEAGGRRSTRIGDAAARLAVDLLDLALHPTRLILRRQTGRARDHIRAFVFLVSALIGGNLMILMNVALPGAELRPAVSEMLHRLMLSLHGALLWLLVISLLLVAMAMAWRLAGTHVQFRQLSIVTAYIAGGLWLGMAFGAFIHLQAVALVDEQAFRRAVEMLWPSRSTLPAQTPWSERIALASDQLAAVTASAPARIGFAIANLVWLLTAGWLMVAWQAYSLSFRVSRLRALVATWLWLTMLGGIGYGIARIAT